VPRRGHCQCRAAAACFRFLVEVLFFFRLVEVVALPRLEVLRRAVEVDLEAVLLLGGLSRSSCPG